MRRDEKEMRRPGGRVQKSSVRALDFSSSPDSSWPPCLELYESTSFPDSCSHDRIVFAAVESTQCEECEERKIFPS